MRGNGSRFAVGLLLLAIECAGAAAADSGAGKEIEIFRYDVAPRVALSRNALDKISAPAPFGDPRVDAYVVVVRLAPGERFISAHAEVRDGFFCIPRRGRGRSVAAQIAARIGYQVVMSSAPEQIREPLALVSGFLPLDRDSSVPPPRLKRRMVLKAASVEHHDGYVAALLLVAANPVTRLHVERVVTRSTTKGGKRRNRSARTVALPDRSDEPLTRGGIMSILAGGENLP